MKLLAAVPALKIFPSPAIWGHSDKKVFITAPAYKKLCFHEIFVC